MCWIYLLSFSYAESCYDDDVPLKGEQSKECSEDDTSFSVHKSFTMGIPDRSYKLHIVECQRQIVYLTQEDTWTNAVFRSTVTSDDRRRGSFAATSRQFVNLLQSAISDADQDITITMDQSEGAMDIVMTMHFRGQKKFEWDIDEIPIAFEHQRLPYSEYIQKFEAFSLRTIQLEQENVVLKQQIAEMEHKLEQITTALNGLESAVIRTRCNSGSNGRHHNHCKANCPGDYVLLSGGCSTHQSWRLNKAEPSGNGWYCEAGEDHGTGDL